MGIRLLVCGGRAFTNRRYLFNVLDALHAASPVSMVIHGGARGADSLAGDWANANKIKVWKFPADWNDLTHPDAVLKQHQDGSWYNANAGPIRNQQMLDEGRPDHVIAFPGRKGTADMIRRAGEAHKVRPELRITILSGG